MAASRSFPIRAIASATGIGAVRPLGGDGVEDVGHRADAGFERDAVGRDTAPIVLAVEPLVMRRSDEGHLTSTPCAKPRPLCRAALRRRAPPWSLARYARCAAAGRCRSTPPRIRATATNADGRGLSLPPARAPSPDPALKSGYADT